MCIGPVPVKMQLEPALSPVVAKMSAWASRVLLMLAGLNPFPAEMWERTSPVPAQMCDVVIQSRPDVGREKSSRGADVGEDESCPSADGGRGLGFRGDSGPSENVGWVV
jgi:hypothetical protein